MKKVFSIEKFIADCIEDGDGTCASEVLERNPWAVECNHLTTREMNAIGYLTHEDWMVELPDPTPLPATSESATSQPTATPCNPLYGSNRVGDVVEIQGIPCRIEAHKGCRGCILDTTSEYLCSDYACAPYERYDNKQVSFVRVKR